MNILILCTYPIATPRHGGQIRVRNIVDSYRAAGHSVDVVGVLGSEQYESEEGFLSFPKIDVLTSIIPNPFLMEDYALGCLFASNDAYYRRLCELIRMSPDVIHVEQPWLFGFAKRYIAETLLDTKIVYGAQNIEWSLKQAIVSSYMGQDTAREYAEMIKVLELEATKGADQIACVSELDRDWLKSYTKAPIVLAPNGVNPWSVKEDGRHEARAITQGHRYALYCASAHPPNMTGYFDMFSGGFGSLKPDEKLVIAGGGGWAIAADVRVHESPKLAERIMIAGIVSQSCLEALIDDSHCIVLPLTQGGGTNLKTAEALWSGKHIVATSIAMRGFENFIGSPGVQVTNEPSDFKQKIRLAMALPGLILSNAEVEKRRSVLWSTSLKPFMDSIDVLDNEIIE
jgi:glycosyltransferase involved in cell wall biosynthesis